MKLFTYVGDELLFFFIVFVVICLLSVLQVALLVQCKSKDRVKPVGK